MNGPRSRGTELMLVAVLGLAFVGFFVGVRQSKPGEGPARPSRPPSGPVTGVADAVHYTGLRTVDLGPNRDFLSDLATVAARPEGVPPTSPPDLAEKRASLADRARTRAYNGAPPVIPHPVDARDASSCLACHGDGLVVGGLVAPKIPHDPFTSCTQCHVETVSSVPGEAAAGEVLVENRFAGKPAPLEGARAWPGAPPVIPHSTWMRRDCASCHGSLGKPGMRCSHPERSVCVQCHAQTSTPDRLARDWR